MTMPWDSHHAAVQATKNTLGEIQELLSVATDKADQAAAEAAMATGGMESNSEAGRNGFERTLMTKVKLQEAYGMAETAVAELERYAGGF